MDFCDNTNLLNLSINTPKKNLQPSNEALAPVKQHIGARILASAVQRRQLLLGEQRHLVIVELVPVLVALAGVNVRRRQRRASASDAADGGALGAVRVEHVLLHEAHVVPSICGSTFVGDDCCE